LSPQVTKLYFLRPVVQDIIRYEFSDHKKYFKSRILLVKTLQEYLYLDGPAFEAEQVIVNSRSVLCTCEVASADICSTFLAPSSFRNVNAKDPEGISRQQAMLQVQALVQDKIGIKMYSYEYEYAYV
jgi:hypothetical protein